MKAPNLPDTGTEGIGGACLRVMLKIADLWPFKPTSAARRLARHGARQQREFVKATARQMRAEMGLPPLKALR